MGLFSRRKKAAAEGVQPVSSVQAEGPRTDLVVPLISGQEWLDGTNEMLSQVPDFKAESYPFAVPWAAGIYITYAIDPGPSWEFVQQGQVEEYGGAEVLHATAMANLRRRGDTILTESYASRYHLTVPDERDLSASLILDTAWRASVEIDGDVVIGLPTRAHTYVCAASDQSAVAELAQLVKEWYRQADGKPVSPDLYLLSSAGLTCLD